MKRDKRLYAEFKPEHYGLLLAPDRENKIFHGSINIRGRKVGRPSRRITLHQKGLKIKTAQITRIDKKTGKTVVEIDRINSQKSLDELRLHTKEQLFPGEYQIEIGFSGKITEPMHGIYPCNFKTGNQPKQLIATQFESHHAREAFPCIDEPDAKASFDLTLESPAGETVIANTPIKEQISKNKIKTTVFETTPKMSSYLLAFAYGELDFKEAKTDKGVDVRVYATPDKVSLTGFALDVAVRCLEFFEDYYGVPYPLPKLDLVGLPDFSSGAMENWGLITFREQVLYVDPKNSSVETKQYVAMVVCHEIAHQWFGNLVTMKWWNDLWLNESFANLMEYRAVDALFPEWDIWQDFARRELGMALSRDCLPNVQPVQVEVRHPDELTSVFDPAIVYAKGGALLNMLRWYIGEDSFRKGLKNYFEENQYGNTEAADLWKHLEAASGHPVSLVMENWLAKPGFPVIEVDYEPGQRGFSAHQQRLVLGEKTTPTTWQVPLAASLKTDRQILESAKDRIKVIEAGSYPLTLNHDGHSYLAARYLNSDHFSQILEAVKKNVLSPIDRLLLVQSYLLLERAGLVSTLENIKLLPYFDDERDESVWSMLSGTIGNARALIDKDETLEACLNGFVWPLAAPIVRELGWRGGQAEPARTQKLRTLALSLAAGAEDPAVVKEGLRLFKGFSKPADLMPDVREVVYYIAVRYGNDTDFNKLLKLHNSVQNAEEKEEIAAQLTASRDPSKIKKLLSMIVGPEVRLQDAPAWFAWLLRNRYATDMAWQWLADNWSWVNEKYGSDKSYDLFPRYAGAVFSYESQLKAYKDFFEPKSNIALARTIQLGIEEINSRVAWRERNEQSVKQWLSNQSL